MLSTAAFNALLKTLEEPPPHAIFILATTEIHKIPATVLSRCQRHEFRRVPLGEITRRLDEICKSEGIDADPKPSTPLPASPPAGMRDAISLLDQLASTGGKITLDLAQTVLGTATSQSVIGLVQAVIDHQPGAGLDEIHRALDGGADARALARQIVDYLRNIMLIQMGNGEQVEVPNDTRAQMVAHAKALPSVGCAAHDARLQRRRHRPARWLVAVAWVWNWLLPKCWNCRAANAEVVSAPRAASQHRNSGRPPGRIQPEPDIRQPRQTEPARPTPTRQPVLLRGSSAKASALAGTGYKSLEAGIPPR